MTAPLSKTLRAALYSRFSSEMQSPRSCNDQEREGTDLCNRETWPIVLRERDEALRAGASAGRAGWARILAAARRREFDVLVLEEVSRFSRDFFAGMLELAELRALGIRIADARSGLVDLNSRDGQMRMAIELSGSENEVRRLGERSKRGQKGKVIDRYSGGGEATYGLQRAPEFSQTACDVDGRPKRLGVRFSIDPVHAPIVKRIFQQYADGWTKCGIARDLNARGVPSKHAGRLRRGRPNSGTWQAASISKILGNEIYIGRRDWNKNSRLGDKLPSSGKKQLKANPREDWVPVENYAPPIIDAVLWETVQARLKVDADKYKKKRVANADKQYLLSGILRCASCGASFVIGMHRRGGVSHYCCSFRKRGKSVCSNSVRIPQPGIEERVRQALDAIVKDPSQLKELVREHNRRLGDANEGQLAVVRGLEDQHARVVREQQRLLEAVKAGDGAVKLLVTELERCEKTLADLAARIDDAMALVRPLLTPAPTTALADYITGTASVFEGDHARDRGLLERVLDKILIYATGEIVLSFKRDSLFAPVMRLRTRADATGSRMEHRQIFDKLTTKGDVRVWASEGPKGVCYATTRGRKLAADEPDCEWFELAKTAPGGGEITLATPTGQERDFGADCERTLATPTGFEPVSPA